MGNTSAGYEQDQIEQAEYDFAARPASSRPRHVKRSAPLDPRGWVTLVIPARNEERCIAEAIEKSIPFADEIVVVDGHSVDRTVEIAEQYGVRVVKDNKRGKGEAIRVGALAAVSDDRAS